MKAALPLFLVASAAAYAFRDEIAAAIDGETQNAEPEPSGSGSAASVADKAVAEAKAEEQAKAPPAQAAAPSSLSKPAPLKTATFVAPPGWHTPAPPVQTVTGTLVEEPAVTQIAPANPAIYGPINGTYVTLEQFQQWQRDEFARNQAAAAVQYATTAQGYPTAPPNPYLSGIADDAQGWLDTGTNWVAENPKETLALAAAVVISLALGLGGRR